jgi:hypothetical protein
VAAFTNRKYGIVMIVVMVGSGGSDGCDSSDG